MNRTFKDKLKNVIIGVLATTTIGAVAACFIVNANAETTALKSMHYTIASVDENGEIDTDSKSALVSKEVNATGLKFEYTKNATATATVHWYTSEGKYISSSEVSLDNPTVEAPETADKARVEITPIDDNYISTFEQSEYVNQVKVTVKN